MNVIEAIQANPTFEGITESQIKSLLIVRGIEALDDYKDNIRGVELVSADLYHSVATIERFSEGSLSVKYSKDTLLKQAEAIYRKYGDEKASLFDSKVIDVGVSFE